MLPFLSCMMVRTDEVGPKEVVTPLLFCAFGAVKENSIKIKVVKQVVFFIFFG
jgi:hypothetical protein